MLRHSILKKLIVENGCCFSEMFLLLFTIFSSLFNYILSIYYRIKIIKFKEQKQAEIVTRRHSMKTYSWEFCKLKGYFWKRPRKQKKGKLQFINNRLNPRLWIKDLFLLVMKMNDAQSDTMYILKSYVFPCPTINHDNKLWNF